MQQYPNSLEAKIAAQSDPRMGQALEAYLNNWYANGGGTLFYFNLNCRYGKFGYWGLTDDARNLNTPKYRAAVDVAGSSAQPNHERQSGHPLIGSQVARSSEGHKRTA